MKYLVDTDWIIEFLKGRKPAVQTLQQLAPDGLAISIISYGEVYEGIYGSKEPDAQEKSFLNFLHGVELLTLNTEIMQQFARVRLDLRSKGQLIGDPDILIAATAMHHDLELMSNNVRHFQRINGLVMYGCGR